MEPEEGQTPRQNEENSPKEHVVNALMSSISMAAVGMVPPEKQQVIEDTTGWKFLRLNIPRIIDFGRREGILPPAKETGAISGVVDMVQDEGAPSTLDSKKNQDVVQIPTNDISFIHEAIPFLPVPPAVFCFILNILVPGLGTILSGFFGMCMGQPRIQVKDGRTLIAMLTNCAVGFAQFATITFLCVGWFWSVAWGGLLFIHSLQYRNALLERRKEAVATAAIEALTKDSILHRRDVKNLVQEVDESKSRKPSTVTEIT